jgi:hypothetical protein
MRHLAAIAIVPALAMMLAGCGERSPQQMAQDAVRTAQESSHHSRALSGARSKQDLAARYIEKPELRDEMTIVEADRIARLIANDRAVAYGITGVSADRRKAFATRYAELPTEAEYRQAQPVAAPAPQPVAVAAVPVLDHRARFAEARKHGVTITSSASPSAWTAVDGTEGRDVRGIFVEGGVAYAWGPAGGSISRDGGETWESNDVAAIAGVVLGGKVFALDGEGGIVSDEGFEYGADLPRYDSIGVSGGSLVATSRTKLAYLRLDGASLVEAAKFDRATGSFVAGHGKRFTYLVGPDGTVVAYDRERGPQASLPMRPASPTPVGRPPEGYRPIAAVPIPHAISGDAAYADGGVDLLAQPQTCLAQWCVLNSGDVIFAVRPDGAAADLIGPNNIKYETARASLPPGTRLVALVGGTLVAATTNGLWTAPAK